MKPIKRLQLGKKGLTEEFINQIKTIFEKERLVKISILKSACRDKAEAEKIAEEIITTLGKKYDYKLIGYVLTIMQLRKTRR